MHEAKSVNVNAHRIKNLNDPFLNNGPRMRKMKSKFGFTKEILKISRKPNLVGWFSEEKPKFCE